MHRERDQERRERGLALAVGGLGIAALLEAVLLLRAAAIARARLLGESDPEGGDRKPELRRGGRLVVALLVALLGFALLAAFLMRLA
jgi:H+/Cl- antiporter ClcA